MAVAWPAQRPAIPRIGYLAFAGLMSYGANIAGLSKATVNYVVRIIKGAKPANLPVQQPTAFDLAINLTTVKGLGLTVPQTLFVLATELID
jgi:putative tryptophan/tyrosine transport system substrate-binding protein